MRAINVLAKRGRAVIQGLVTIYKYHNNKKDLLNRTNKPHN